MDDFSLFQYLQTTMHYLLNSLTPSFTPWETR